jgi:NAD(P)-dependent dehydrogenase (short-subunit alcohol dehydrogenase family)
MQWPAYSAKLRFSRGAAKSRKARTLIGRNRLAEPRTRRYAAGGAPAARSHRAHRVHRLDGPHGGARRDRHGSNVTGIQGDVANLADLDRLYESVKAKGRIDILFANVGLGGFVPLGSITEEYYDKTFDTNVKGLLFTVQKALPFLSDGASIILTGSAAAAKGTPSFGVYAASKAAIRSFVRTWTAELKDRRIRANVLSPGPVVTPQVALQPPEAIARIVSTVPMGRMAEPEEIAKVALFLGSDDSSFITGIELFADGGRAQV